MNAEQEWSRDRELRVLVIGASGAGKSTLARRIGTACAVPVHHLDRLFWQPGWRAPDNARFCEMQLTAAALPSWVIDGGYHGTFHLRLPRATHVIWLDLPRRVYFPRVLWRCARCWGRQRPDVGEGCLERFDHTFLFDWVWGYPSRSRPRDRQLFEALPPTIRGIRLATRGNVRQFIAKLPRSLTDTL